MVGNPLLLFALLALFRGSQAHGCPRVQPMKSFNGFQMNGKWYVIDWASPFQDERSLSCVEINLWYKEHVGSFAFNFTGVPGHIRRSFRIEGSLHLQTYTVPAEMTAIWRGRSYKYVVLDTDYNTYSVISACSESEEHKLYEYMNILSRRPYLNPEIHQKLKLKMRRNGLDVGRMRQVPQHHCHE